MRTRIGITWTDDDFTRSTHVTRQTTAFHLPIRMNDTGSAIEAQTIVTLIDSIPRLNLAVPTGKPLAAVAQIIIRSIALLALALVQAWTLQTAIQRFTSTRGEWIIFIDRPGITFHTGATSLGEADQAQRNVAIRWTNTRTVKNAVSTDRWDDFFDQKG